MEILDTKLLHETKFLSLWDRVYKTDRERNCFFVSRNPQRSGPNAVIIVAFKEGKLILLNEFRIALNSREICFPAGMIEENESIEAAAIREFHEETGMKLSVCSVSPRLSTSAGITNETACVAYGLAEGEPSKDFLDGAEDIETMVVS